jgi:hypothetical protein
MVVMMVMMVLAMMVLVMMVLVMRVRQNRGGVHPHTRTLLSQ